MPEQIKVTTSTPQITNFYTDNVYLSPNSLIITSNYIHSIKEDGPGHLKIHLVIDKRVYHEILAISRHLHPEIPEDYKCEDDEA